MPDLYSLHQETNGILGDLATAISGTHVDLAEFDYRVAKARLGIDEVKAQIETIEAALTDDVLAQEGLTNEARRKSAISKALSQNEPYKQASDDLRKRQYYLRIAEADASQAQAQRSASLAQLHALGKAADLVSNHLHLLARTQEVEAAKIRLTTIAARVQPNQ